jgi:hypothetical protein
VALKSVTAAEESKDQLSRDFSGRSIFDFCNNICQKQTSQRAQTSWFVRGDFRLIVSQDQRIWLEGAEKFVIAQLYPIETIAGDRMEAFDVHNGDPPPADFDKTGTLEGALDQIDGGHPLGSRGPKLCRSASFCMNWSPMRGNTERSRGRVGLRI